MSFKFYPQLESVDCGPACLQMVLAHLGHRYSLSELKSLCNITRLGITLHDIINGAKKTGLDASPVKATVEQLEGVPLPAVLFWRQEHYVVLYSITQDKAGPVYNIADPAYGKIQLTQELFQKEWCKNEPKGFVLILHPSNKFGEFQPSKEHSDSNYAEVLKFGRDAVGKFKGKFAIAFFLFMLAMATGWVMPFLLQAIMDLGVTPKKLDIVLIILFAQLCLFVGNSVSDFYSSKFLMNISFNLGLKFLHDFLFKLIKLPISFFDIKLNTDLIQRVEDQDRLQGFLTYKLLSFSIAVLNLVAFSLIILYYNAILFLIFLVFTVVSIGWTMLFLEKRKILDYSRFSILAENKSNIYEMISGMPEIKLNNAQSAKLNRWQATQEKLNAVILNALNLNYYQIFGVTFFNKVKDLLIIALCAYFVINNKITIGVMMSVSYIIGQLARPVDQIVDFIRSAQDAKLSFDRMHEIQHKSDENIVSQPLPSDMVSGFCIDSMSFKYEGSYNKFVLNNLSICIPKGKTTAVVGTSGSGKTTLLKILLGFYYPQKGDVYIDNHKLSEINVNDWRGRCGVVMQDGYIFSGTISENIALADEVCDLLRLNKAIETACIGEFIGSLPMGINTKIGKSGIDLSGGQKQRILIARAVYKNPDFLFFDEATSSLDANNESKIMQNLTEFLHGKTVVIIAHRLSTVKNADQIIVLDKGTIIEAGHHDELISNRSSYFELVRNQLALGN
ncbi:ABC transporter ATP-binding protein [Hymenobacter amundsenii]|uniref:ABC transporter ATP-binding protein n=1 Tax=Hymenobacter amundsenii TaxID=2006685 RepID=A0A246FGC5_9BACT|nr:peptidase domain-containing ABC transporter [Hymenobacter amundsenii]OWP61571.1 ABC transporter ATP-binding protein [Hymenobacter amundsenii]